MRFHLRLVATQQFVIVFNQVIPKPFCASGPNDFLLVQGLISLRQQVVLTPSGNYESRFQAEGRLDVTPVDPATDPPTLLGASFRCGR